MPALGIIIDAGAMISMFACALACITAAARILLLMAHNGLVPTHFCKTHHRNETPHLAVVLTAAVVLIPTLVLTALGYSGPDIYGWLGSFAVYGFITIYGLICIALPLQLKRQGASVNGSFGGRDSGGRVDGHGPGRNSLSRSRCALFLAALSLLRLPAHDARILFPQPAEGQYREGHCRTGIAQESNP